MSPLRIPGGQMAAPVDPKTQPGLRRVRAVLGGRVVADTTNPLFVWEGPHFPLYYIPVADVDLDLLHATGDQVTDASRGTADVFDVVVENERRADAALRFVNPESSPLLDHVRIDFDAMDHWFEEDEEIFVHPRDPHVRISILASSRRVRIEVRGTVLAESDSPTLLLETGARMRWYLPLVDVDMTKLRSSDSVTHCPYKGRATYWSVVVGDDLHEDLVWTYRSPVRESAPIAGLACFYDEKVDVFVDGERQERRRIEFA